MTVRELALNAEDYCKRREEYPYPPAKLITSKKNGKLDAITWNQVRLIEDGPIREEWESLDYRRRQSSMQLDTFNGELLNSDDDDKIFHGVLSVVYWGFYADRVGKIRRPRAWSRAKQLINGRKGKGTSLILPQAQTDCTEHFKKARLCLRQQNITDALHQVSKIKFLGMAFATKLLAFTVPADAGVYDSVISKYLKEHKNSMLREMGVGVERCGKKQCDAYQKWCLFCQSEARILNESGVHWRDWNGDRYAWRAIDVERVHFALAAKQEVANRD